MKSKQILVEMRERLRRRYGPARDRSGDDPWWTTVGLLLASGVSWRDVEGVLANLRRKHSLSRDALLGRSSAELAAWMGCGGRGWGKAERLRAWLDFFQREFGGDVSRMREWPVDKLRAALLSLKGIGPETADAILLYALGYPVFVVDVHVHRVFTRHALAAEEAGYEELQEIAMRGFEGAEQGREFHDWLVQVGRQYCRPRERCEECPLQGVNW